MHGHRLFATLANWFPSFCKGTKPDKNSHKGWNSSKRCTSHFLVDQAIYIASRVTQMLVTGMQAQGHWENLCRNPGQIINVGPSYVYNWHSLLGFKAQRLKVCRTQGPRACLRMLTEKHVWKRCRKEKKSMIAPRQPRTCSHLIYSWMLTGIRMFSLCFFHVLVPTGILESDLLSLSTSM